MMQSIWSSIVLFFYLFQTLQCRTIESETGNDADIDEQTESIDVGSVDNFSGKNEREPKLEKVQGNTFEIELFPVDPSFLGHRRQPRTIFPKLHSAASFLAGLKLGKILSKKGFELGHGKIASSHTFQLFGKTVNSATSLAYGDSIPFLPALDESSPDTSSSGPLKTGLSNNDVYHVTVVENPSNKTIQKMQNIILDEINDAEENNEANSEGNSKVKKHVIRLYQESNKEDDEFLKEHNNLVKEINQNLIRRTNSKF